MYQEVGETRDAIIEDDNRRLKEILDANKNRQDPYWIVLFVKQSRNCVDGKRTLVKHFKPYGVKPRSQVGAIIATVDNKLGKIDWEVNMPQSPFDFDKLPGNKGTKEVVIETTSIPGAYITK